MLGLPGGGGGGGVVLSALAAGGAGDGGGDGDCGKLNPVTIRFGGGGGGGFRLPAIGNDAAEEGDDAATGDDACWACCCLVWASFIIQSGLVGVAGGRGVVADETEGEDGEVANFAIDEEEGGELL